MQIGQIAKITELSTKTIRYYEEIGLINTARADNGYRNYDETDLHKLTFIKRARNLGFTIDECRLLLSLYQDKARASADVKALAQEKITEIDYKMLELQSLRATLNSLVNHCHGDNRPDCPILDKIAGKAS